MSASLAIERLNPANGFIRPGSARTYAQDVVRARWYQRNLGFDLDGLIETFGGDAAVVVDVSAGTGAASEYLLGDVERRGRRLARLVLTDVDLGLARAYLEYAMKALETVAARMCDRVEYVVLKAAGDGGYSPVSAIDDLRADCAIMANAIHLVPAQQRLSMLRGLYDALKPGGIAILGSGSLTDDAKPAATVRVDELFAHVRKGAVALLRTDPAYAGFRSEFERRHRSPAVAARLERVFPAPPRLGDVVDDLVKSGFAVSVRLGETPLDREDYRPFITGVPGYVKAAVLPEIVTAEAGQAEALFDDATLMALVNRAYDEVYDAAPGGRFVMGWTSIRAVRPASDPGTDPTPRGGREP